VFPWFKSNRPDLKSAASRLDQITFFLARTAPFFDSGRGGRCDDNQAEKVDQDKSKAHHFVMTASSSLREHARAIWKAATGRGNDALPLPDKVEAVFGHWALDWPRADHQALSVYNRRR
jgi:hypothetical protein